MKDQIAMKIYDTLEILENKRDELVATLHGDLIKSITGYDFLLKPFPGVFND
jgi:hypothetical protein